MFIETCKKLYSSKTKNEVIEESLQEYKEFKRLETAGTNFLRFEGDATTFLFSSFRFGYQWVVEIFDKWSQIVTGDAATLAAGNNFQVFRDEGIHLWILELQLLNFNHWF